jgi:hypothetical protein
MAQPSTEDNKRKRDESSDDGAHNSGSESEEDQPYYGKCGKPVGEPCNNHYCCHPDRRVREMQRELDDTARCNRLDGYFSLGEPDYETDTALLKCKECGSEDSLYDLHDTLLGCKKCCYSTRPWNFPYKSKDAELCDLSAKEHAIEVGKRLIKGRVSRARKRAADLEACHTAASDLLSEIKKRKTLCLP